MSIHQLIDGRWFVQYRRTGQQSKKREYFGRGIEARKRAADRDKEIQRERGKKTRRKPFNLAN